MAPIRTLLVFAAVVALAPACAPAPPDDSSGTRPDSVAVTPAPATTALLSGTVTYRQRIALPPDAEVTVSLGDVSRADAAAVGVGETTFRSEGRQVPLPFSIPYDPSSIDPAMTYGVRARVMVEGKLAWTSDTFTPALTQGGPRDSIEVILVPVGN